MINPITRIQDDVIQVRLPLPFALKTVNCYLVRGRSGWSIFDTGLHTAAGQAVWQEVFRRLRIGPGDVARIVLTHCHPDHYGMSGWLQRFFSAGHPETAPPVLVSQKEYRHARNVVQPDFDLAAMLFDFFSRCGLHAETANGILANLEQIRAATRPHPEHVEFLEAGTTLTVGKYRFQLIHTPGHSDGHLIFYDRRHRLALSGDHVLLKITPNISLWPLTEANPLGRYLHSLEQLEKLEVDCALPGHKQLITDWRKRVAELQSHHHERLQQMKNVIDGAATPFDVCARVFDVNALSSHEIRFAVTETLAHLEYLVNEQTLQKNTNHVWTYMRNC